MPFTTFPRTGKPVTFAAILAATLMTTAAFAHPGNGNGGGGGNGGGNAGGNGGGSHSSASSHANKATAAREDGSKVGSTGLSASSLGGINGFLHASPRALAHASPKSRIGKIATVYAGELKAYLADPKAANAPTLSQLSATLASAANKPLTPAIIQAVDAKLASTDATLSKEIAAYQGGASGLATAISSGK